MRTGDPCILVIFGASGDLTSRKLVPAMYEMHRAGMLANETRIMGVSRRAKSDDEWRAELEPWVREHAQGFDADAYRVFAQRLHYFAGDAVTAECYPALRDRVAELDSTCQTRGNLLFYLSVAPELYEPIIARIDDAGLVTEGKRWCSIDRSARNWQRIVVEKPFGTDAASAASLNRALGRVFEEESIYRIDHYLGKELVQSLLVMRFANMLFEPIWNHRYVDHVQVTAAETVGVGSRTSFYDHTGAIRDMIQSHLMQIFAFVAMEPPTSFNADAIRQEKIKVVDAVRPTAPGEVAGAAALGQYAAGTEEGAYVSLPGVAAGSTTETYAAIRLHVDNWRWAGTPFYLRSGKRMAQKRTEVVVQFKPPAANLFRGLRHFSGGLMGNRLVIEIAPRERTLLTFESKVPGESAIAPVAMEVDYAKEFRSANPEAYGPLLVDAMRGDQTLFKHRLEVEGAWHAVEPFIGPASAELRRGIGSNYSPGSWGPESANELMRRDGRAWHD